MSRELIPVSAVASPFSLRRADYMVPAGLTVAEIIEVIQPDPLLREHGVVFIGETMIARDWWGHVRPKPGHIISLRLLPGGAGGWRIAAMVAIAVAAVVVSAVSFGTLSPIVGPLAAGAIAGLAGAAISIGGTFLVNTLLPAPVPEVSQDYGNDRPSYAITGQRNRMAPWEKLPFVAGAFRVTPPYAAQPWTDTVGGNINYRCVFAIGHGPLQFSDLKIGDTPLSEFDSVQWDFRRGYWSLTDKGGWNAASGVYPTPTAFADTWTVTTAGTVAGVPYKVGETITFNNLLASTNPAAWDRNQGKYYDIFPHDVAQADLNVEVKYGNPVVRTTATGADFIRVQLVFPRGLAHIQSSPPGKRSRLGCAIRIEQAPAGSGTWSVVAEIPIFGQQTTPLYWGKQWATAGYTADPNKQYDVRITRMSADYNEDNDFGNFTWFSLASYATILAPVPGVATIAMWIQATGQLSGALDEFNCVAQTIARTWNGTAWTWGMTSNPAALARHMLQHPSRQTPATDAQIDLDRLEYWSERCDAKGFRYDGVFEAKGSLYDALISVGRVGRAAPTMRDLLYSVIIDEPKTVPVRLFTPRNSWGYRGEMTHARTPHAYRVGFVNAARDWQTEEVVVYDDGYSEATATRVDRVEWPGIINRSRAWKEGRFHLAQQRLRREVHTIETDFEHLIVERGDLVALQHDAIAVGITSARVVARATSGGTVTTITVDSGLVMEAGKTYGVRARRVVSGAQQTDVYQLVTVAGTQTTLTFATAPTTANAPAVGDLVALGEWGSETRRLLVRDIQPHQDLTATLTLIDEAAGVHTADTGTVPPWDPGVTQPTRLPAPVITGVASDDLVMAGVGSTYLTPRIIFGTEPCAIPGVQTVVLYRPTGTDGQWLTPMTIEATATLIAISGVASGSDYDFRIGRTHPNYLASPMTQLNSVRIVGRANPPQGLQHLSLSPVAAGTQAMLQWDAVADLDVQYGGRIVFRHSAWPLAVASWGNSTSLGQAINGNQTNIQLPLKPGVYLARVYDTDGNESPTTAVASDTKQMSALGYTPFAGSPLQEHPAFAGTKENCVVVGGVLQLAAGNFDDVPDVDALSDWDTGGTGYASMATYHFAQTMDFGSVQRARITGVAKVEASGADLIDGPGGAEMWDAPDDVDGTDSAPIDVQIWGRLTDDDPGASPVWGEARRIDCMEITCRAVGQLEARITTESQSFNVLVFELSLYADHL